MYAITLICSYFRGNNPNTTNKTKHVMIRYDSTTIGTMVLKQGEKRFKLQIRKGNCLAVIINVRKADEEELKEHPDGKYIHTLYTFYADEQHLKNMMKMYGNVLADKVVSIELNLFYKENYTLLKYFVKSGHKVKCYYKEEEKKK